MNLKKFFFKSWPIWLIFTLVIIFFWKFFFRGLLPIPADIVVGLYYPWLDYKWGYVVGVPVKNNLLSDVVSVIYPFKMYAIEVLKNGHFPLWNPLSFSGSPLFANFQSGILYPLSLLYFILRPSLAWSLQIVAQPLLAVIFTYLFLRNIKFSKIASLLGGIIYAFSGFSIIWLEYNIHGHVAAFVPLFLFLADRFLENNRWGIGLSLAVGMQILAGYPQVSLYSFFLLGVYFLYRVIEKKKTKEVIIKKIFQFSLFLLLGLSLAAVQLIPGFELLRLSQRTVEGLPGGETIAFLPWEHLITFLAPDFFGNPATGNFWFRGDYSNTVGYVGLSTLVLAFTGLVFSKRKEKWLFGFLAAGFLFYVFPTPIAFLARKFTPFAFGAAASTRAVAVINFLFAVLAVFGFEFLWKGRLKQKNGFFRIPFYFFIILIGIALGIFVARKMLLPYEETFAAQPEAFQIINTWVTNLKVSLRNMVLPIMVAFTSLVTFFAIEKLRRIKKFFLVFLFLILVLELFRFGWKYLPFVKEDLLFPETPVIKFLKKQEKPFRMLGGGVIPMNMWTAYGLESIAGYDAVYPLHYAKFLSVADGGRVDRPAGRYGDIKIFKSPLLDLSNVKYILAIKRNEQDVVDPTGMVSYKLRLPKFKPVFDDQSVRILENVEALPRAFIVYKYRVIPNEAEIIDSLLSPDFNLAQEVVLEKEIPHELTAGEVEEVNYERAGNHSLIRVDHSGNGLLFVSDSFYPGWKAFVDGKETPIYRADFTFRAVFVPEGKHTVRFIYDPQSFKIGAVISLVSLAILGGLFVYETKKRRRTSS